MPRFDTPIDLLNAGDRTGTLKLKVDGVVMEATEVSRTTFHPITSPDLVPMQPLSQPLGLDMGKLLDSLAADVLDPDYPIDLVDEELRQAGIDPDEIRKNIDNYRAIGFDPDA